MDADLQPVIAVVAELSDMELTALTAATDPALQIAPGLLSWLEHLADWEINRRVGIDFPLQPPDAAIPPEEDAATLEEAMRLRALYAQDERADARGVAHLLDAVVGVLTGCGRRFWN